MIRFKGLIEQFREKGEKTGWSYIEVPLDIAEQLKPENKKSFRVKGKLDNYSFEGISLLPMGEGNFIMALKASIRKVIEKQKGDTVLVTMEIDSKEKPLSAIFMECLEEEPKGLNFFNALPESHQKYFSNWIESAKTESTKAKRIAQAVNALSIGLGYGEMMRMNKRSKNLPANYNK
jgi:hypothetical protein